MARTVRINPLVVLVSVLVGVELFGFVGALLAVPVAGAGNVVVRELWAHRPASPDELIVVTSGDQAPPTRARRAGWLTRLRRLRGAHGRPAA
jgi:hypothetical protein